MRCWNRQLPIGIADKQNGGKRSILNNAAYSIFQSSESSSSRNAGTGSSSSSRRVTTANYSSSGSFLQRSVSADNVQVVRQRGFKPSDRHDPVKRNFLESLTSKILHFDMEDSGHSTPIDLQKLLTPASDSNELLNVKNKKMYASSYFYAPTHPTVEDQVELARRISNSLSDVKNVKSKGQSMYVNRKKRSVKWIHDGNGVEDEEEPSSPTHKDKVPLKCMMNPSGKLLDIHGVQALGEEPNIPSTPPHPERLFDIVRDLNTQKGRGAEIFAKRRKRSEKWVVDTEQPQSPSSFLYGKAPPIFPTKQPLQTPPPPQPQQQQQPPEFGVNENTKFDNKPFYNPFALDISMDYSSAPVTSCAHLQHQPQHQQYSRTSFSSAHSDCGVVPPCHTEIKKIYLREVAVGPDEAASNRKMDKSRRLSYDGSTRAPRSCNSSVSNGYSRASRGSIKSATSGYHQYPGYQSYHHPSRTNGYNGHHHHHHHNGHSQHHHNGYTANGFCYHQQQIAPANTHLYPTYPNNHGYQNHAHGYHHNSTEYLNGNGYQHQQQHHQPQPQTNPCAEETEDTPQEDYTPVPVKQLIQEFEKTCRPIMQYKQCAPRIVQPPVHNGNDISRFFESRRELVYHNNQPAQRNQFRSSTTNNHNNNGYASSGDDEDDDEDDEDDDDDDDGSLDDSLSPVDFYRIDDRRLIGQTVSNGGNRSSSMSTLDEYYRRQLLQQHQQQQLDESRKFQDSGAEVSIGARAAALAAVVAQDELIKHKKHLRNTPVLENLVAGTTTPECFKKEFTEEVATKLYENSYHGPKISSYQNLTNYNTAPRGWDQSQAVYRPVKFEKPQDNKISYSDF